MIRRWFLALAAACLGVCFLPAPAWAAAPMADPTGCTTSIQWVQQGSNYFYGQGNISCTTGSYKAKVVCHNNQTGVGYVAYGTQVVNAPATATALCLTGNTAETVLPVANPLGTGLTGCAHWTDWVTQGSNLFYGRGGVQCDTGRYKLKVLCHNNQTGDDYIIYGTQVVTAPASVTATCNTGNTATAVQAVADPPGPGVTGCLTWSAYVVWGNTIFYGRGNAQCDSGRYEAVITCQNVQTGQFYTVYSGAVTAPATATTTCNSGNTATAVVAQPV